MNLINVCFNKGTVGVWAHNHKNSQKRILTSATSLQSFHFCWILFQIILVNYRFSKPIFFLFYYRNWKDRIGLLGLSCKKQMSGIKCSKVDNFGTWVELYFYYFYEHGFCLLRTKKEIKSKVIEHRDLVIMLTDHINQQHVFIFVLYYTDIGWTDLYTSAIRGQEELWLLLRVKLESSVLLYYRISASTLSN